MKKKLISAVLCAVMTASLVAGCGLSGGTSASSSEPAAEPAAEAEAEPAAEGDAAAAPAASGDVITLTMAEVNPLENTVCGAMDLKFKEEVERLSGGQIQIDLQGGGVLGVEADILDGMLGGTGTVDICRISAFVSPHSRLHPMAQRSPFFFPCLTHSQTGITTGTSQTASSARNS